MIAMTGAEWLERWMGGCAYALLPMDVEAVCPHQPCPRWFVRTRKRICQLADIRSATRPPRATTFALQGVICLEALRRSDL